MSEPGTATDQAATGAAAEAGDAAAAPGDAAPGDAASTGDAGAVHADAGAAAEHAAYEASRAAGPVVARDGGGRRRGRPSVEALRDGILDGNITALSRAITLAESRRDLDARDAQRLIAELLPRTGGARRVGLTGVPGAGKSTTIEALGLWLIEQGHKVAVLTIDPSSSKTGGSILGDKTRMQRLSMHPDAYIRPSPSAGTLGGVARRTREAMLLCEAAGFDVVIVESVGVGQSEAELAEMVDCLMLLLVPGAGDELQGIKRGIVEMADLIVVNKADGDALPAARRAAGDYRHALRMLPPATAGWKTQVLLASALTGDGLDGIWEAVEEHRAHLESDGSLTQRRHRQQVRWLHALTEEAVLAAFRTQPGVKEALAEAEGDIVGERATVPQAVERLLDLAGLGLPSGGLPDPTVSDADAAATAD